MDLLQRIDQWASCAPERLAHVSGERTLTYDQLRTRSDSVAAHIAQQLGGDRSPVAIIGHKEPEMLIGFLGAVKAGHPYVPLDTDIPSQRIDRIVASAGVRLRLGPAEIAGLPESALPRKTLPVGLDDPYYIIFTSGSTGEPKGVTITLRCLSTFLEWMMAEQRFENLSETFLNQAPFSFDLSVMDLYLSLATGGTLFSVSKQDVADLKRLYLAFARSNLTIWVSTPSFAQLCLVERTFDQAMLPRLRRLLFCGETLPPQVAAGLVDRFPQAEVWNTYGPTEATVATTSIRIDREILGRYPVLPVGFPMPGGRIALADEQNGRGEIVIAGSNVSAGYWRRSDLTAASFFMLDGQRAYRTGDWGRFEEGMLFFEGRIDDQIKLNGYRVELGEVESSLRSVASVADAVAVPSLKKGRPGSLTAFVVLRERKIESDFELSNHLRAQLSEKIPAYMLPRKFVFLDAFPLTANGKADRRRLAESLG